MVPSDLSAASRDFFTALCRSLDGPRADGRILPSALGTFGYPAAVSRGFISFLVDRGYLRETGSPLQIGLPGSLQPLRDDWWELTAKGAEFMLTLVAAGPAKRVHDDVPASDRFVSRSDNESAFNDADTKLVELIEAVRTANDLRVTADERLAVQSELQGVRSLIAAPVSRAAAIFNATRESAALGWLAKEVASGTIRALAAAAIVALLALIGWSSGAIP